MPGVRLKRSASSGEHTGRKGHCESESNKDNPSAVPGNLDMYQEREATKVTNRRIAFKLHQVYLIIDIKLTYVNILLFKNEIYSLAVEKRSRTCSARTRHCSSHIKVQCNLLILIFYTSIQIHFYRQDIVFYSYVQYFLCRTVLFNIFLQLENFLRKISQSPNSIMSSPALIICSLPCLLAASYCLKH